MTAKGTRRRAFFLAVLMPALLLASCGDDDDGPAGPGPNGHPTIDQFTKSETCGTCHPTHYAEWSGSMHAYSMRDPTWIACANLEDAATGGAVGQFCVSCHSPIGFATGLAGAGIDPTTLPDIIQEGVSCQACHLMSQARGGLEGGNETGAHHVITPGDTVFGQLSNAQATTAHVSVRDEVYDRSEICQSCHDYFARGEPFEITWSEWNNSSYSAQFIECQDCHMETYTGQAAVGGPIRENLTRHDFVGADVAMIPFPNRVQQRERVAAMLRNAASLSVDAPTAVTAGSTLGLVARVTNDKTGHNIPSGVSFIRQMWLEVVVRDAVGETLFVSGDFDSQGDLRDANSEIDPGGDTNLKLWQTTVSFDGAAPGVTVFVATGISEEGMLEPNETEAQSYSVPVPAGVPGPLDVSVRLLFRPFPAYTLRGFNLGDLQDQGENPVFEMNAVTRQIDVGR